MRVRIRPGGYHMHTCMHIVHVCMCMHAHMRPHVHVLDRVGDAHVRAGPRQAGPWGGVEGCKMTDVRCQM